MSRFEKINNTPPQKEQIIPPQFEKLANVTECKRELLKKLQEPKNKSKEGDVSYLIYEMLTTRSEFSKMRQEARKQKKNLTSVQEKFASEIKEYDEELLPKLFQEIRSQGLEYDNVPGWISIGTRPDSSKKTGGSCKVYMTIPVEEYTFIEHIPNLIHLLSEVSRKNDDVIKLKFKDHFLTFLAINDSLVIHFKNPENKDKVLEALRDWAGENDITEGPRELGRTKFAADPRGKSFSKEVSDHIAKWVMENAGKYDNEVLAESAIKHAIELSQKPPEITDRTGS